MIFIIYKKQVQYFIKLSEDIKQNESFENVNTLPSLEQISEDLQAFDLETCQISSEDNNNRE